jgi:hypothetical protein
VTAKSAATGASVLVGVIVGASVGMTVAVAVSTPCTVIQADCGARGAAMLLGLEVLDIRLHRSSSARQPMIQDAL